MMPRAGFERSTNRQLNPYCNDKKVVFKGEKYALTIVVDTA